MPSSGIQSPSRSQRMPSSGIPSPSRSQGKSTSRRYKPRASSSRSVGSPARSNTSVKLTSVIQMESFVLSPMPTRRSVLTDTTDIDVPRRKSWWKKLDENSQEIMDVLHNQEPAVANKAIEEYIEVDVLSQEKKNYTLDLPESSDGESISSIVIPQRKLFTQKESQPYKKFDQIIDNRESLAHLQKSQAVDERTLIVGPKNLFNLNSKQRRKPIFPEGLLNISGNKTIANKTKELAANEGKVQVKSLFGYRPGSKRKNMFADFIASESEDEIPDIQPKVFGFNKIQQTRKSTLNNRGGREPSPSSITDIEIDDWRLLPSSTMVDHQLEDGLRTTPNKRSRLCKLSEARETVNTTVHKTTRSEKSSISKNNSNKSSKFKEIESNELIGPRTSDYEINSADNQNHSKGNYVRRMDISNENVSQIKNVRKESLKTDSKSKSNSKLKFVDEVVNVEVLSNIGDKKDLSRNNKSNQNETLKALSKIDQVLKSDDDEEDFTLEYDNDDNEQVEEHKENESINDSSKQQRNISKSQSVIHEVSRQSINASCYKTQNEVTNLKNAQIENKNEHPTSLENLTENNLESSRLNSEVPYRHNVDGSNEDVEMQDDNENNIVFYKNTDEDIEYRLDNGRNANVAEDDQISADTNNKNQAYCQTEKLIKVPHQDIVRDMKENEQIINENIENKMEVHEEDQGGSVDKEKGEEEAMLDSDYSVIGEENIEEKMEELNKVDENNEHQGDVEMDQQEDVDINNKEDVDIDIKDVEEIDNQDEEIVNQEDEEIDNQEDEEIDNQEDEEIDNQEDEEIDNQEDEEIDNQDYDENDNQENEEIDNEEGGDVQEDEEIYNNEDDDSNSPEDEEINHSEQTQEGIVDMDRSEDIQNESQDEVDDESDDDIDNQDEELDNQESEEVGSEEDEEINQSNQTQEYSHVHIDRSEDIQNEVDSEIRNNDNVDDDDNQDNDKNNTTENMHDNAVMNTTHDTTGRHRKKQELKVPSPEIILHDKTNLISNQMESFTVQGRNTSVRKTKSMIRNLNIRPSLASVREDTGMSDGTRNSSAEGSGWDSHRTTRATLRKTFGKDFTPRKSLRTLVMEKSAKRQTNFTEINAEISRLPQANSTEFPEPEPFDTDDADDVEDPDVPEELEEPQQSDHEESRRERQTILEMYLQNIKKQNMERKQQLETEIRNSLNAPTRDPLNPFKIPAVPKRRWKALQSKPKTKPVKAALAMLPAEILEDLKYKPPKRYRPTNASWITKRLYKFLETKLEPKYDYKARIRSEKLVETIYKFTRDIRRQPAAPREAVAELKREMARLDIVKTHFEFNQFFHEYMPREVRVKVVPDVLNKIPLPKHGIFSDILR